MRHASARNVVERIFGVIKKRWGILTQPPHFSMGIQVQVPPALAALHNFIMDYDPNNIEEYLAGIDNEDLNPNPGQPMLNEFGTLENGPVTPAEKN